MAQTVLANFSTNNAWADPVFSLYSMSTVLQSMLEQNDFQHRFGEPAPDGCRRFRLRPPDSGSLSIHRRADIPKFVASGHLQLYNHFDKIYTPPIRSQPPEAGKSSGVSLLCYLIGIEPLRLPYGRAANYGSIIVPCTLSSPYPWQSDISV